MSLYNDKTCALVTEADAVAILVAMTAICFNTQPSFVAALLLTLNNSLNPTIVLVFVPTCTLVTGFPLIVSL